MTYPSQARVLVLATGGTIAGRADDAASSHYSAGQLPVQELLAFTNELTIGANIEAVQVANIGSQDMDYAIWQNLHERIAGAFSSDAADAVVVMHGTDTAEETAFLLDLTIQSTRPVIVVSAMRPANAFGADGPRNLANAMCIACDPASRGRGVLLTMNDRIFSARDVYKAATQGADGYRGFPGSAIGTVTPSHVHFMSLLQSAPWRGRYQLPRNKDWPSVAILFAHANMDICVTRAILSSGISGLILAGVGHGNASQAVIAELAVAAAAGKAVVRTSQIAEGTVTRNLEVDDDRFGFNTGGSLSAQKCRLLLQLIIANGIQDANGRQQAFDQFQ